MVILKQINFEEMSRLVCENVICPQFEFQPQEPDREPEMKKVQLYQNYKEPLYLRRLRLRPFKNFMAPAPCQFQKQINKNEKKMNDSFACTEQKLKETWIRYNILNNLLVMKVFL